MAVTVLESSKMIWQHRDLIHGKPTSEKGIARGIDTAVGAIPDTGVKG